MVSVYVMWGTCLQCYCKIIKISAISLANLIPGITTLLFVGCKEGRGDGAAPTEGGDDWVPFRLYHFSGFLPINDELS